jgi:ribosomal protein S18
MDCYFCQKNIKDIDFKDVWTLKKFIAGSGKIRNRKKTDLCSKHQRHLAHAIKKARHFGLLSPTSK